MLISFGKFNFKKYIFISVPIMKLIREISGFSDGYYGSKNILIQYLFLCVAKFANVIFWFILKKNIKLQKPKNDDENSKKEEIFDIIQDKKSEEDLEKNKRIYSRNASKGLSQKEIDLFAIEKKKKIKHYKEIGFLIITSLVDIISNFSYLISYASVSYEENEDKSKSNYSTSNFIEEILLNYISSNSTDNSTDNNNIKDNDNENNDNIVNIIPFRISVRIIIFFILSLFFFYYDRPHRHQFVSLLIIIITILFADFLEILLNIQKNSEDIWIHLLISLVQEFFFCLYNILGAKYLSISHGNIYKLLFFNGFFGILMTIGIHFSTGIIRCNKLIDEEYCDKDNLKNFKDFVFNSSLINLIPSLLLTIVEVACTWLLISYQTVNHLAVAYSIHLTFRFLIGRKKLETNHIIIGSLSFIVISFFALVYDEIFVLRFCGLEKNTSEEIDQRAIEDKLLIERISAGNSFEIN